MVLFIDTSANQQGKPIAERASHKNSGKEYEYIATADMNIAHCVGCNFCWLKTPGICVFDDDYKQLPLPVRFMVNLMFKTYLKRKFQGVARKWGCDIPLDRKVFDD